MRGIVAVLLVALSGFSSIPFEEFASQSDSPLPPCCRRGGKHHCTVGAGPSESSPGPAMQSARCSLYPAAKAIPANRTLNLPGISHAMFAGLASHPHSCAQTEALCRISYSRAGQKRGPPTLLS